MIAGTFDVYWGDGYNVYCCVGIFRLVIVIESSSSVVSRYDLSDGLWLWLELVPVSVSVLVSILYSYHIFILNLILPALRLA